MCGPLDKTSDNLSTCGLFLQADPPGHENMNTSGTSANFRQGAVSAAVWPWCSAGNKKKMQDDSGALRRRALIQALVAAGIGAIVFFVFRRRIIGFVLWAVALMVGLLGLLMPAAFRAVDRAMQGFGRAVGTALTWLLLVPFFYLVFIPGHLLLRLLRKDPLQLRFSRQENSYWTLRRPLKPDHFRKQF